MAGGALSVFGIFPAIAHSMGDSYRAGKVLEQLVHVFFCLGVVVAGAIMSTMAPRYLAKEKEEDDDKK